jgi:ribosomal protein L37E
MACGELIHVLKPSGINLATLEMEDETIVLRKCGSTSYSGNMNLCGVCANTHRPTYEYERDNPSYEEDY